MKITATADTYLKKYPNIQAVDLLSHQKVAIANGRQFEVDLLEDENDDSDNPSSSGHMLIEIGYGAGEWWIWPEHWGLESQVVVETPPDVLPEWNTVRWDDFGAPVSKWFTVGEVCLNSRERIVRADGQWSERQIKENVIKTARYMDEIREWWGGPLAINSWLRNWKVQARIGSRAPNHPSGTGVDFRPMDGSIWELQKRFKAEWYDAGRHNAGLGLGANRGFLHVDGFHKRIWNY